MIEGAAASGGEEGQTRGDDEDASRGTRRPSARAPTGRARRRRPRASGEMQTRSLLTHSTWQEKKRKRVFGDETRHPRRGGGSAVDGRPSNRAREGETLSGGDVPVRNARAISRYRSSARSNGRNNLPRLDESDEAVAFLACTKGTFSVFRIPTQNRRKFPKNEEFLAREDPRARGESYTSRIFSPSRNSENTPVVSSPRPFFVFSAFPHWTSTHM